jgi:RNA polymerase primary sigma factor
MFSGGVHMQERNVSEQMLRFARYEARAYYRRYGDLAKSRLDYEDFEQAAYVGLLKSLDKADESRSEGEKAAYARFFMKTALDRLVCDNALCRVPINKKDELYKVFVAAVSLAREYCPVNDETVSEKANLAISRANCYLRLLDGQNDRISPDDGYDPIEDIIQKLDIMDLVAFATSEVAIPSERDRNILIRRYGLDGEDPETLKSIGKAYGVSGNTISVREHEALKRLRRALRSRRHTPHG